jgi:glutamine synthetase
MERLRRLDVMPVVALEIEFYLPSSSSDAAFALIREAARFAGVDLFSVECERGPGQFEFSTLPSPSPFALCEQVEILRGKLRMSQADFSAKPYPDQFGSGLHVHVHLENAIGANLFWRDEDRYFSPLLFHAIGGLLAEMKESMPVFAPSPESLMRFTPGSNAPTTVSWGTNNRTTAIRLPPKPSRERHIEHRVAGADANLSAVVTRILQSICRGLEERIDPGEPIYGDASLAQYACLPLAE